MKSIVASYAVKNARLVAETVMDNLYRRPAPAKVRKHMTRLGELLQPFEFWYMGQWFFIEPPFWFDGASIPRFLFWAVRPFTRWVIEAALVHDWLYRFHADKRTWVSADGAFRPMTRREMDRALLHALVYNIREAGGSRRRIAGRIWRAHKMYIAVRKVGWAYLREGDGKIPETIAARIDKTNKN